LLSRLDVITAANTVKFQGNQKIKQHSI